MFSPLRKKRQEQVSSKFTGRYFIYAISEIALVVVGILIALWINNWNEAKKLRKVEIDLLEGIKNDLYQDTLDINSNIRAYERSIEVGEEVLDHLINKKPDNNSFVFRLLSISSGDLVINFRRARFDEAKTKGLAIISNPELRASISQLYEFDYQLLGQAENSLEPFDSYKNLQPFVTPYVGLNAQGPNISKENYRKLLNDEVLNFKIASSIGSIKTLLQQLYQPTKEKLFNLVSEIEAELDHLKN